MNHSSDQHSTSGSLAGRDPNTDDPLGDLYRQLRVLLDRLAAAEPPRTIANQLNSDLATLLDADWFDDGQRAGPDLTKASSQSRFAASLPVDRPIVLNDFAQHPSLTGHTAIHPPLHLDPSNPNRAATVTFGAAHEGFPGMVHGGHLLAVCDVVGGQASAAFTGVPVVTRALSAKFVRPCPIGTTITASTTVPDDGSGTPVRVRLFEIESDATFVIAQVDCAAHRSKHLPPRQAAQTSTQPGFETPRP